MKLAINLKNLREDHDLMQKELAEILQVGRTSYGHYEQGRSEPDIKTIIKIADYYNISIDSLIGYEKKGGQTFDQEKLAFKTKMHEELFNQINLLNETQLSIVKDIINSLLKTNQSQRKESI